MEGEPALHAFPKLQDRLTAAGCAHLYLGLVQKAIAQVLKVGPLLGLHTPNVCVCTQAAASLQIVTTLCATMLLDGHAACKQPYTLWHMFSDSHSLDTKAIRMHDYGMQSRLLVRLSIVTEVLVAWLLVTDGTLQGPRCIYDMQGLEVLHSCGFCSLDCKSSNVMVSMGPLGEDLHCTLVDLGSATRVTAGQPVSTSAFHWPAVC